MAIDETMQLALKLYLPLCAYVDSYMYVED